MTHLEILREEIDLVTNRKNDLQKRVQQLVAERENLASALEEASDKILVLEKLTREQECQVQTITILLIDFSTESHNKTHLA